MLFDFNRIGKNRRGPSPADDGDDARPTEQTILGKKEEAPLPPNYTMQYYYSNRPMTVRGVAIKQPPQEKN